MVLHHLVLHHTHAGLLNRHLGKRDTSIRSRQCGVAEDFVNLLLAETRISLLCSFNPRHKRVQLRNRANCHDNSTSN
ncbi:hypothetical protein D3C73_717720 [compost metagenome]